MSDKMLLELDQEGCDIVVDGLKALQHKLWEAESWSTVIERHKAIVLNRINRLINTILAWRPQI